MKFGTARSRLHPAEGRGANILAVCLFTLLGVLCMLYVNIVHTGRVLLWPCPLFTSTGIECPGCGITRCVTEILRFRFLGAMRYHPVMFALFFALLFAYVRGTYGYIAHNRRLSPDTGALLLPLIAILLFTLVRNLPGYPFPL